MKNFIALLLWVFLPVIAAAQNSVTANGAVFTASFEHISCHVNILHDDNHNSTMQVLYKLKTAAAYKLGAETMRAWPEMIVDNTSLNMNFHAGSAMFLEPDQLYDIRLVVSDGDGGNFNIDREIKTKSYPKPPSTSPVITVTSAGGSSAIQTAVNNANPGDIIEIENGTYAPFKVEKDSIYIRSKNLHQVIINGGGTPEGVITAGTFSRITRHVFIDGLVIKNGKWGLDAQNTQFLTLQNCDIENVDFGIVNRRENGWESDQFITNNRFKGNTTWPQTGDEIPGERGVDIRGNNNTISFNTISDFGDGISTDGPPYKVSYGLDIHHNDITRIVDDLIEVDGMISNSRIYRNRAWNGRAGVSLAPVFGGPAYVFRNEFVNMEYSTYKMNRGPSGLYIVHNTTVQSEDGMSSSAGWQSTIMKNNLIFAREYCFQEYGVVAGSSDDWDYNGYYSARTGSQWFKWNDVRYSRLPELVAGTNIESDGIQVSLQDLINVSLPANQFVEELSGSLDLMIVQGSLAKDAGIALSNINEPFVQDGIPDLGAYEKGAQAVYGHDFTNSCGRNDLSEIMWTGAASKAWFVRDNWLPCGIPEENSKVTIPDGLPRYPSLDITTTIMELELSIPIPLAKQE